MQNRSPIIVRLLFAATVAVDCVSVYWLWKSGAGELSVVPYLALTFAQVSLLAAWAVFGRSRLGVHWLAPLIGGLAAGAILVLPVAWRGVPVPIELNLTALFGAYVGIYELHAAGALLVIWLLKPSRLVRRAVDIPEQRGWQFSVGNLLILMTCVSLLLALLVRNELLADAIVVIGAIVVGNNVLLVALVAACSRLWHWLLRLGASLAAAIAIGFVCTLVSGNFPYVVHQLVQAGVLFIWLELSPILPRADDVPATDDATAPAEARADPPT